MKWALCFFILFSCSHKEDQKDEHKAQKLLSRMSREEKYHVLRAYQFLHSLTVMKEGYLSGIPRLGIPAVELIRSETNSRKIAREEKTLKLGFVNLINDSEKTQVFGNFNKASAVDAIMEPELRSDLRKIVAASDLRDLDLYLVQQDQKRQICTQFRGENDFHCVTPRMGLMDEYPELLEQEKFPEKDLNQLVSEVLRTMDKLQLI